MDKDMFDEFMRTCVESDELPWYWELLWVCIGVLTVYGIVFIVFSIR